MSEPDGPKQKLAVVLFNLGGPDSPEAVVPFLFNLFFDKAIINAPGPIRWLLAKWISFKRGPIAKKIYDEIGGRSPILELTQAQAKALASTLQTTLPQYQSQTFVSMRYWHPFAHETVKGIKSFAPDKILLLPLYPQFSTTTTGSSFDEWKDVAARAGLDTPTKSICCFPVEPGFVAAQAKLLNHALGVATTTAPPGTAIEVLFSAHGLPKATIERTGDPYPQQVAAGAKAIVSAAQRLSPDNDGKFSWKISYQSRVGPLEWIGPDTEDEIKLAGKRNAALIIVPIAFVSEHSETLVELDIEYKDVATKAGVATYIRVPAVGTHPDFIAGLADLVSRGLSAACEPVPGSGCAQTCAGNNGVKNRACPAGLSG